ncbi:unnamed protein product [Ixodes hexagonus]
MAEVPYFVVYDFESIFLPCQAQGGVYEDHIPSSFCIAVVRTSDGRIVKDRLYRGNDCVRKFISAMEDVQADVLNWIYSQEAPIDMQKADQHAFDSATHCNICKEPFGKILKVRDHDHQTRKYRQALCQACNLKLRTPSFIPVPAHNMNYDISFILKYLHLFRSTNISIIASSCQKLKCLKVGRLRFIDSLAFLGASLATLAQDLLSKGEDNFKSLRQFYPDQYTLLCRKGVFCYNYITSLDVYDEPGLPPREAFFNKLNEHNISEEDYQHAAQVYQTFKLRTLGEYSDLYLQTDCFLRADIFQNFRRWVLETFQIEPLYFISLPSLSWAAALKHSKVELALLSDPTSFLSIESSIRGGITQCNVRHATANVPGTSDYDPEQAVSRILDLDVNELYGATLRSPLPFDNFKWLTDEEISKLDIQNVSEDSVIGYFLEVDLDYPDHLHDLHSDLPLAPVRANVEYNWLSDYQRDLMDKFSVVHGTSASPKRLLTLYLKRNYFCHYSHLQLCLRLGLRLLKIHRVLQLSQKPFFRDFIEMTHDLRKKAPNSFQKCLCKLFINSIYGNTLQNPRKFSSVAISVTAEQVLKHLRKPTLKQFRALSPEVVLFQFNPSTIQLKHPLYIGFTILELSKLHLYRFYYDHLQRACNVNLLYCDTDSFIIKVTDPHHRLRELDDEHLDNSDTHIIILYIQRKTR